MFAVVGDDEGGGEQPPTAYFERLTSIFVDTQEWKVYKSNTVHTDQKWTAIY